MSQISGYDPHNPGPHNLDAKAYDPAKLVLDVVALLEDRGLTPSLSDGPDGVREAQIAASMLLRGIGIRSGKAPEDWLDLDGGARYDSQIHGD